ncbi:MAG: hypothetical protein HKP14_08055, partial [Bacteroidia bacterium]|nr:hypothetical protein [Bacteroidia bacterium]
SSDSQRTRDTLGLMKKILNKCEIEFTRALYLASANELLENIYTLDNRYKNVLILAHNPGITNVFYNLANVRIDNVPTAGVGCIRFDVEKYSEIRGVTGELEYFSYPKMLV